MVSGNVSVKFTHAVITRAPGLLPMLYSPKELEEELKVSARTIREWINLGMPHRRDAQGHIWINGEEFAKWIIQTRKAKKYFSLKSNEALCLRCHKPVKIINPQESRRGKHLLLTGICPNCRGKVYRGGRVDQSD